MKTTVYNQKGEKEGTVDTPSVIFDAPWNPLLVKQVVVSLESNKRMPYAHTKDRSEVRGGGRKPWRQKGTGRARHGSKSSPIWRSGGITFGPLKDKNFQKKINKKMKTKALFSVLSQKMRDGEVLFVDSLGFSNPKAKDAREILTKLGSIKGYESMASKKNNALFIMFPHKDEALRKSFDNFGNIETNMAQNMSVLDILKYKYLVIVNPKESVKLLEKKIEDTKKDAKVVNKS